MGGLTRTRNLLATWVLLACSTIAQPVGAQLDPALDATPHAVLPPPETRTLRVAVAGNPPFVDTADAELGGLSVDVWHALILALPDWADATLAPYDSVPAALDAVTANKADLALGPISITAQRATRVGFSQPYYFSDLAILAPAKQSFWARLAPFATRAFGAGLLVLLLVLAGVGTALWLAERRANPTQFPHNPVAGISSGIWLALVTMTTVGYGDMAPRTRYGRLVAGVWMLLAMITASSLTASIATALTLSQLETPGIDSAADLSDRQVAVLDPSPAADFVRSAGGRVTRVDDLPAAVTAVLEDEAHAIVWDRPVLAYYLQQHPDVALSLSDTAYDRRGYGIAARHGDRELLRRLDVAVLRLQESGDLDRITRRWLKP